MDDHKTNIIGRNLLPRIGIKFIQEKQTHRVLNVQEKDESNHEIKQCNSSGIIFKFSTNMRTHRKIKTPRNANKIHKEFEPIQQKGRRIPIHLQGRFRSEFKKLVDQ